MSIITDIATMVDRLARANIPSEHLCYMLDEHEWRSFTSEIEEMHLTYSNDPARDYSYIEEMRFMGMHVRKRTARETTGKP
jgi:hypothetical protein